MALMLSPHCGHPHVRETVASGGILGLGSTTLMSFTSHGATSASWIEEMCPEEPLSSRAPPDTWLCTCKSFKKQTHSAFKSLLMKELTSSFKSISLLYFTILLFYSICSSKPLNEVVLINWTVLVQQTGRASLSQYSVCILGCILFNCFIYSCFNLQGWLC